MISSQYMDKVIENYRKRFPLSVLYWHAQQVLHAFIGFYSDKAIENAGDRVHARNLYAQIYAAKFLLDEQFSNYPTKLMFEQALKRMEEKLEQYDSSQRETRLARKQSKHRR